MGGLMGGGSSSATPTTPVGYTGGSVMDYTAPAYSASPVQGGGGFNWGAVGQGLQSGAQAYGAASQTPIPQFGSSDLPNNQYQGQQSGQPTTIQMDPQMSDAIDRILTLLKGGY